MLYSMDLRRRVIRAHQRGQHSDQIAERYEISARTVREYIKRDAAGELAPKKSGPRSHTRLFQDDQQRLLQHVQAKPDATLAELAALIEHKVVLSTIHRFLVKHGYRCKKNTDRR